MQNYITYEHPLNERVRTLLRLDFLFRQYRHFMAAESMWDSRAALACLMDMLLLLGRGDLKTELIKELERHEANLGRLVETPDIDHSQLKNILHWLSRLREILYGADRQLGQELRDNEFLAAIRQRSSIPGGTCDFDLPLFHHWLHLPHAPRQQAMEGWYASLDTVRQAVELILKLIRNSAEPMEMVATGGAYQHVLDSAVPFQLIRIGIPDEHPVYAEISGGKHRFSVRFMKGETSGRPRQITHDILFRLACCVL